MAILLCAPDRDLHELAAALNDREPALDVRIWPALGAADEITFAVLWKHPPELIRQLPALRAVSSLGAGVDHLLSDPSLPPQLPIGRLAGPRLAYDMAGWVVAQVFWHWRRLDQLAGQQAQRQWQPWAPSRPPHVGLLGFGVMGQACAEALLALGCPVSAWVQRARSHPHVRLHHGHRGLLAMASEVDYLVCLLPSSTATRGLIDAEVLAALPAHAVLINAGRGDQVVDTDLLTALDQGQLALAILDSFQQEPLPAEHPFWVHPKVRISPHCAAITQVEEAAAGIVESYHRLLQGQAPLGHVPR